MAILRSHTEKFIHGLSDRFNTVELRESRVRLAAMDDNALRQYLLCTGSNKTIHAADAMDLEYGGSKFLTHIDIVGMNNACLTEVERALLWKNVAKFAERLRGLLLLRPTTHAVIEDVGPRLKAMMAGKSTSNLCDMQSLLTGGGLQDIMSQLMATGPGGSSPFFDILNNASGLLASSGSDLEVQIPVTGTTEDEPVVLLPSDEFNARDATPATRTVKLSTLVEQITNDASEEELRDAISQSLTIA